MKRVLGIAAALAAVALLLFLLRGERATSAPDPGPKAPASDERPAAELVASGDGGAVEPRRIEPADTGGGAERVAAASIAGDEDGCTVQGRVTDASGAELVLRDGCRVRFEDANGDGQTVDAGEDGSYSISRLAPGRWLVSCRPLGYRLAQDALELRPEYRSVRHDIALRRAASVRVRVLAPDGRPFATVLREHPGAGLLGTELVPVATAVPPGVLCEGIWGSKGNTYGVGWLSSQVLESDPPPPGYAGTIMLDGDPPVYVSLVLRSAVLATELVGPGEDEVVFTLTPERLIAAQSALRLQVVEADTLLPLASAKVSLFGGSLMRPSPGADEQGVLALEGLAPGTYDLWLYAEGREHLRRSVMLPPGEVLDLGTVALAPEVRISGRVVDAAGEPVAAMIELGRIDPATRALEMFRSQIWSSNALGVFDIDGLGRGEYVLRTNGQKAWGDDLHPRNPFLGDPPPMGLSANRLVSTRAGSAEGVELVLVPRGRLLLRGERADGAELRYQVLDGQGLERAGGRLHEALQLAVDLPRGDYQLRVTGASGSLVLDRQVTVGETPAVIELPRE